MSVEAMAWVWNQAIPPNCKLVLLAIADHADPYGSSAFPSQRTLSRKTGYTTRQIRRVVDDLVNLDVLRVQEYQGGRYGVASNRRSHLYRVMMKGWADNMSSQEGDEPVDNAIRADICDTSGRTPMSAKPSLEPPSITSPSDLTAETPNPEPLLSIDEYLVAHPDADEDTMARWIRRREARRARTGTP